MRDVFRGGKLRGAMDEDEEKRSKAGGWPMAVGLLLVVAVGQRQPAWADEAWADFAKIGRAHV